MPVAVARKIEWYQRTFEELVAPWLRSSASPLAGFVGRFFVPLRRAGVTSEEIFRSGMVLRYRRLATSQSDKERIEGRRQKQAPPLNLLDVFLTTETISARPPL